MTTFAKESEFETAVIQTLRIHGWGDAEVIKHPSEVVSIGDVVQVLVLGVDVAKKRISLSMKQVEKQ